jgi:hypothetical protein
MPRTGALLKPARERFPNLAALADARISRGGGPVALGLKAEAGDLLDEVDRLQHLVDEGVENQMKAEARRPDYLARAVVAAVIVLLIAWTLGVLRLGQGMLQ